MKKILDWIERTIASIWGRIKDHASIDEADTAALRVIFGVYLLFVGGLPSYSWLANVPDAFYNPPALSLPALFSSFPDGRLLTFVDVLLPLLILGVTAGIKARWCGIAAGLLCFTFNGFSYSFGKIDHGFATILALLLFSFSNWGVRFALVPDRRVSLEAHRASIALLAICLAFGMVSAGFDKARQWIDFDLGTSGFLFWFNGGFFTLQRDELLAPMVLKMNPKLFELADYAAVCFELSGFLFLLLGRIPWRIWLVASCAFHLANILILNIAFDAQFLAYAGFILPLESMRRFVASRFSTLPLKTILLVLAGGAVLIRLWERLSGKESGVFFGVLDSGGTLASLYFSCGLWLAALVLGVWQLRHLAGRRRDSRMPIRS